MLKSLQEKKFYLDVSNKVVNQCIEINQKDKVFFIGILCNRFCEIDKTYMCDFCINDIAFFNRQK